MILFLTLLLNMSLSASCVLLVYLAAASLLGDHFPWRFRYHFLKLCLFLFLFPFPFLKCLLPPSFPLAFGLFFNPEHIELERTIHIGSDSRLVDFVPLPQKRFLLILGSILLLALVCSFASYIWMRRMEKRKAAPLPQAQRLLDEEKKKLHISRKIQLFHSSSKTSPYTYGLFYPVVVVTDALSPDELRLAVKHELIHIKRMDFLFLILAYGAFLLHFLNPLVFVFWEEFRKALEISCDEILAADSTDQERLAYGHMLINIQEALNGDEKEVYTGRLACANRELLHLRLYHLAKSPVKKTRFFLPLLLCLALAGTALPLAASTPPILIRWENGADSRTIRKALEGVSWGNRSFFFRLSESSDFSFSSSPPAHRQGQAHFGQEEED